MNCAEMARDRPSQRAYKIISIKRMVDFIAVSSDSLGSRRATHAGVKEGYSSKSGCFTAIGL